jgi:ABC-type cobalamin transport system ATPase subunit
MVPPVASSATEGESVVLISPPGSGGPMLGLSLLGSTPVRITAAGQTLRNRLGRELAAFTQSFGLRGKYPKM